MRTDVNHTSQRERTSATKAGLEYPLDVFAKRGQKGRHWDLPSMTREDPSQSTKEQSLEGLSIGRHRGDADGGRWQNLAQAIGPPS